MTKRTLKAERRRHPGGRSRNGVQDESSPAPSSSSGGRRRARRSEKILNYGLDEVLQSRKSLASRLKVLGLRIKDITGDGNCLFRAVSMLLHGSESAHKELRDLACRTLLADKDVFRPFVMDSTVEEHVEKMRQLKEYGGHLELAALANALQVNIAVYHTTSDTSQIQKPFHSPSKAKSETPLKTIHLVYDSNCLHYDATIKARGAPIRTREHIDEGLDPPEPLEAPTCEPMASPRPTATSPRTPRGPRKAAFRRENGERTHSPLTARPVTPSSIPEDIDPLAILPMAKVRSAKKASVNGGGGGSGGSPGITRLQAVVEDDGVEAVNGTVPVRQKVRSWLEDHLESDLNDIDISSVPSQEEGRSIAEGDVGPKAPSIESGESTEGLSDGTLNRMAKAV